jgi:predicted outer membrane repeat protein
LLALSLAALGTVSFAPLAQASQPKCLVVGAGGSFGTLQEAVDAASAGDTLKVKGTCYGDVSISKDLTIVGQSNPGFGPATLNGGNSATSQGAVVTVNTGFTVVITDVTITGGYDTESSLTDTGGEGGGIVDHGLLTLNNSTVIGNRASDGGGISTRYDGSLTVNNSIVSRNTAHTGGGGIVGGGPITLNDSTVCGNTAAGGGGIYAFDVLTLNNSTVTGNKATLEFYKAGVEREIYEGSGGVFTEGKMTLNNSRVSNNQGGGLHTRNGPNTLNNSIVADNLRGGRVFEFERPGGSGITVEGRTTLNNSTVSGNGWAARGGGIYNKNDSVTLNNSTVSGNVAGEGGGIYNGEEVTLNNSTVSNNTATPNGEGGGILNIGRLLTFNGSSSVTGNTATEQGGGIFEAGPIIFESGWTGTVSGNTPDDIFP